MLARTFLPAANLNITEKQRDALIAVLLLFEGGWVEHGPIAYRDLKPGERRRFNMHEWDCGTSCCIGGWADTFGAGFQDQVEFDRPLNRLFFPNHCYLDVQRNRGVLLWSISIAQASAALRNYLERGDPCWLEILGPRYIER